MKCNINIDGIKLLRALFFADILDQVFTYVNANLFTLTLNNKVFIIWKYYNLYTILWMESNFSTLSPMFQFLVLQWHNKFLCKCLGLSRPCTQERCCWGGECIAFLSWLNLFWASLRIPCYHEYFPRKRHSWNGWQDQEMLLMGKCTAGHQLSVQMWVPILSWAVYACQASGLGVPCCCCC